VLASNTNELHFEWFSRQFDDRRDYVAAGRALGMQAFVYDPALPPPAF